MTTFDEVQFARSKASFHREYNRVEPYISGRRKLTSDIELKIDYRVKLVQTFNELTQYIRYFYEEVSSRGRE